ncbi:MAG: hypothetical protein ABIF88_01590 [archaeon]
MKKKGSVNKRDLLNIGDGSLTRKEFFIIFILVLIATTFSNALMFYIYVSNGPLASPRATVVPVVTPVSGVGTPSFREPLSMNVVYFVSAPFLDFPVVDPNADNGAVSAYNERGELMWKSVGSHSDFLGWYIKGVGDVSGDGRRDVLVGVPYYNLGRGRVDLFSGNMGSVLWSVYGAENKSNLFGAALDGVGNLKGLGSVVIPDVLIGSPDYDLGSLTDVGSIEIYSSNDGSFLGEKVGVNSLDHFGAEVAVISDLDGDGYDDFLVAALDTDSITVPRNGTVHLYVGTNERCKIVGGSGDHLGRDIEGLDDIDGDGVADFAVGAPNGYAVVSPYFTKPGYVRIFSGLDCSPITNKIQGINVGDNMGWSISYIGDVNNNGVSDIVAGSPLYDSGGMIDNGRIYVIDGTGAIIRTHEGLTNNELFGYSVANVGDLDGDSINDYIVGSPRYKDATTGKNLGRVFVFSGRNGAELHRVVGNGGRFGWGVAGIPLAR